MSYRTPSQTPERQCEPAPEASPPTPSKNRALAILSSPIRLFRGLGSPASSRSAELPPQPPSPQSLESPDRNEPQRSPSPGRSSQSSLSELAEYSIYERALAPLKSSRQRQKARLRRIHHIINLIDKIRNEGYLGEGEVIPIQLFPKDYTELLLAVDEQGTDFQYYFHRSLRYEYRESRYGKNQFTIFMPSAFHIHMQGSIDGEVSRWSGKVKDNDDNPDDVKTAADKIQLARDRSIETAKYSLRPDCSFKYKGSKGYPPLAFEIAWSQQSDKLKEKAMELIQESSGEIRTVVGLDFSETYNTWKTIWDNVGTEDLPNRGPATAFIWRAKVDGRGNISVQKKNYKFCNNDGSAHTQPRARFQLSLKDFIPSQVLSEKGWEEVEGFADTSLEFDSTKIMRYFDDALEAQKEEDEGKEPKKERKVQETTRIKRERAARRSATAEREHRQWSIRNVVDIGGHSLRGGMRLNRNVERPGS
ncbi:hypothetical protein SAMD00023353_4001260 [Rosellinia necatrix]|uniref:Uncharacterized protein n=1 Tax=Rosellinia necatrix TaxID=77044 RepID=A0A1W2TMB8_ROSNE|nr:hypothetical protein SAMD00023353_4001260 [Rosellinia necatrix]